MKKFLSFLLLLVLVLGSEIALGNASGVIENRQSLDVQKSSAIDIGSVLTVSETEEVDKENLNKELQEVEITRSGTTSVVAQDESIDSEEEQK